MKKIMVIMLCLLTLSGIAVADTNIWSNVENEGGYSSYKQMTSVGGYDWSEGSDQITGTIYEGFVNDGAISLNKEVHNDGEWLVEEKTTIFGEGDTSIFKHVDVWTEDSTLWEDGDPCYRNPDGEPGELAYPTELWVEYSFSTPTPFYDSDTFYAIVTEPPAEVRDEPSTHAYYNKYIDTDDEFAFGEKTGIGDFPSDFVPREPPEFPDMCWFEWI